MGEKDYCKNVYRRKNRPDALSGFLRRFYQQDLKETWIKYRYWVEELKIGGLAIYRGDVYETANMMNTLQASSDIPLLIAANLEKGLGNQMDGATLFPPIMSIGATGSEELSYQMGKITALEARAAGIHMAYFPVVDVTVLDQVLASETHLRWADSVLEQSMTLVKDTSRILPLSPEKKIAVFSLSSDPGDYYAGRP